MPANSSAHTRSANHYKDKLDGLKGDLSIERLDFCDLDFDHGMGEGNSTYEL